LSSNNVRHSFKRWIQGIDAELRLTPMDIRSSYATMMIRRHVRRNSSEFAGRFSFRQLNEDDFLPVLACVMNTSTEQLREVYAASSHENYSTHVARVMQICAEGED